MLKTVRFSPGKSVSHLASDQDSFFLLAVHQSSNGPGLRVEILHLCAVSEIVDGDLSLGIPEDKLALPVGWDDKG